MEGDSQTPLPVLAAWTLTPGNTAWVGMEWTPGRRRQAINSAQGKHELGSDTEGEGALPPAGKRQNSKSRWTGRVTDPPSGAEEPSVMKNDGFILFLQHNLTS